FRVVPYWLTLRDGRPERRPLPVPARRAVQPFARGAMGRWFEFVTVSNQKLLSLYPDLAQGEMVVGIAGPRQRCLFPSADLAGGGDQPVPSVPGPCSLAR